MWLGVGLSQVGEEDLLNIELLGFPRRVLWWRQCRGLLRVGQDVLQRRQERCREYEGKLGQRPNLVTCISVFKGSVRYVHSPLLHPVVAQAPATGFLTRHRQQSA